MSRHGEELLLKMFRKWEADPDGCAPVTIPITRSSALPYFQAESIDDKDLLHAYLKRAEREGCVELRWGRLNMSHLLERITLSDGVRLAGFLGLPVARVEAEKAWQELQSALSGEKQWLTDLLKEMVALWRVGKSAHGLAVNELREARELLCALEAVCAGKQEGLDLRTFSARYVGDSKAMERMQLRFARIWQKQFPGDELEADQLFQSLGLTKFPLPVLFKGPVTILNRGVAFDCSTARPYIGFPPQGVDDVIFPTIPRYVLFIENPACFNRHVTEVVDDGLVLYTAGFPSSRTLKLYQLLDEKLPESIQFFHWGDLDLGGMRIKARIQTHLRRRLHPHLMTRDLLEQHGQRYDHINVNKLAALASRHENLKPLIELLLSFNPPLWLEQESVDPRAPELAANAP